MQWTTKERVSDCSFTQSEHVLQLYIDENKLNYDEMKVVSVLY